MKRFPEIKGRLGFGCMRLPMADGAVDTAAFSRMVDCYLEAGFNYFDTARGYLGGKSETALRDCLTSRYPREKYILTDKLSVNHFTATEQIPLLIDRQLASCGVSYFDFYLMHSQERETYEKYKKLHAYETALSLKEQGKFRHFGISFHDKAELLEEILTDYPEVEVVQIQLNYYDYDDASVESRKVLEVCEKFEKPVFVMEPVKGGSLARLPKAAEAVLDAVRGGDESTGISNASYAIRFAAGFDSVEAVLSGMGTEQMVRDNVSYMKNFVPLSDAERDAVFRTAQIIRESHPIPCTACRYCTDGCPKHIRIPDLFACMNDKTLFDDWNADYYYEINTAEQNRASDCIRCGQCEKICPQHLPIRDLLRQVAEKMERD